MAYIYVLDWIWCKLWISRFYSTGLDPRAKMDQCPTPLKR